MMRHIAHPNGVRRVLVAGLTGLTAASLTGCGLLDVDNPNNLVEEDLQNRSAAAAVVSGALATISRGTASMAAPFSTASDELFWIGSRDAWNQLNLGNHRDYANEFTDAAFPEVAEGRWMADLAIETVEGFVEEGDDSPAMMDNLARAYLYAGLSYVTIAEYLDDFALSDKMESAAPLGPGNMDQMFSTGIGYLDEAVGIASTLGEDGRTTRGRALALRARAKQSLAIWQMLNPPGSTPADPLVAHDGAAADAQAAMDILGEGADWSWALQYGSNTISNDMSFQVNERGELQIEPGLVSTAADDPNTVDDVVLLDPIDGVVDPALSARINGFVGESSFAPLTVASERLMHLIIAEDALAGGDEAGFAASINAVRALDDLTPYTDQVDPQELLIHSRRVNLFLMNLRLNDMFRFGITSDFWLDGSAADACTGVTLPITIVEAQANTEIPDGPPPACPS